MGKIENSVFFYEPVVIWERESEISCHCRERQRSLWQQAIVGRLKKTSIMQLFCSHCWREINVKISGSLWSLGKRCKVYTDKSTSCSITYTAELAQKSNQTIEGKEESWSSQGYFLPSLLACTPICFQDEKHKNLHGRIWSLPVAAE